MNDLAHPADPGFRVILALLQAGIEHRKLGRLLPDWPQDLKDTWHREDRAYREAWHGMWDVFCDGPDEDEGNPGKDATADCSVESEPSTPNRTAGMPCAGPLAGEALHHDCVIPDPDAKDEPPSRPAS